MSIPLAEQLRPTNWEEFVGQEHLVGKNGVIRKLLASKTLPSIILWGPPVQVKLLLLD
jgi:putative ATPase